MDSIGSCSLDVNATGTIKPTALETSDVSRRNLRSISLENNLSSFEATGRSAVKPILKPQARSFDPEVNSASEYKPPSYLGISCAVNGYSRLNRYDSNLRDGFRSRDESPARLTFSRSRDSSPLRPEWKCFSSRKKNSPEDTAAKIKELKEELARFKAEFPQHSCERGRPYVSRNLGRRLSQGRSVSVDRGHLAKTDSEGMEGHNNQRRHGEHVKFIEINMDDGTHSTSTSSSYQYTLEKTVVTSEVCKSGDSLSCSLTSPNSQHTKSFIQSRIERLYGPSALAAGFRSRRSLLELEKEQRDRQSLLHNSVIATSETVFEPDGKAPEGFPIVFRHLRPEFRTQLPVKRSNLPKSDTSSELPSVKSFSEVDCKKMPGRIIPIQLEGEELPPVPLPKTESFTKKENGDNIVEDKSVLGNGGTNILKPQINNGVYANGSMMKGIHDGPTHEAQKSKALNGLMESNHLNEKDSNALKVEKNGHYYLKIVTGVVTDIESKVQVIEEDLELHGSQMTEEIRGKVLAAIGKGRLLISQKIQQFIGLCHKNIDASQEEEFPTTSEDLAGFWDMVSIQVNDIHNSLQEIAQLKANDWKEAAGGDKVDRGRQVMTGHAQKKPAPKPVRASKSTKSAKTEEGKAREEARKKMMEDRRRAMKEAMKAKKAEAEAKGSPNIDGDAVEIFVSEKK